MTNFQPTKISCINKIWKEEGFTLKKSLSQNFLIDQNVVNKIIDAANITSSDTVLEIGPGSGALTLTMLERGATVYAVEYDKKIAQILKKYLGEYKNFHLIESDILETDISFLPKGTKIVSNLPYHITSPIIAKIADHCSFFTDIILMVQKEMADRILAKSPSSNRSSFSIFTSYYFEKKSLFIVKPGCFTPRPKVDSVIISLKPKDNLPFQDPTDYLLFVRKAFSQKRKMLTSVLEGENVAKFLKQIGQNEKARPQELSEDDFINLYKLLSSTPIKEKNQEEKSSN
jgi:16S rRNA (adenine1518-N6/adenine1519-N6)-dimethyltransferase